MTIEAKSDRGPEIGLSIVPLPSYEDTFATGVETARRKLRKLPPDLVVGDDTRLSDYEQSSLKRLAAMNAWAEEYNVTLLDGELSLLNGTTIGRLVSYMQRKRALSECGKGLTSDELDGLRARAVTPPELSVDVGQPLTPDAIKAHRLAINRINDELADLLLGAMNAKLMP